MKKNYLCILGMVAMLFLFPYSVGAATLAIYDFEGEGVNALEAKSVGSYIIASDFAFVGFQDLGYGGGDYGANALRGLDDYWYFSLTTTGSFEYFESLSFDATHNDYGNNVNMNVEYSDSSDFSNYTLLQTISMGLPWTKYTVTNIPLISPETDTYYFRLRPHETDEYTAWVAIDNVSVTGSAVPEPTTMLLLGTGLIGLAGARRKFKK